MPLRPPQTPPAFRPIPRPPNLPNTIQAVPPPNTTVLTSNVFAWNADVLDQTTPPGVLSTEYKFAFTNVSSSNVTIRFVRTSCGCTTPHLKPLPWTVAPGESGTVDFTLDVRGKAGILTKIATVDTTAGVKSLAMRVNISPPNGPAVAGNTMGDRSRNLQIAAADRQAIFRGDCASCHLTPTQGKTGPALFAAACGICHEAEHRASMVTNLSTLKHPLGSEYWRHWIAHGKPGSLMPAFAKADGGPLSDEQIESLVDYFAKRFSEPATASTQPVGSAVQ